MATRPYVPRADGESSIGVPTKKWGKIFAYEIDEETDLGNNASLGYRRPSNAQEAGDIRYHATLPAGWYLECTTAGITGSGALTITSPTVGGTVSDGTVTWKVRKVADTTEATPTTKGLMAATDKAKLNGIEDRANNYILPAATGSVRGGITVGSNITLSGDKISLLKSNIINALGYTPPQQDTTYEVVSSSTNGLMTPALLAKLNNAGDHGTVVAQSLTANGYRKWSDGFIEQWGMFENPEFVNFPITFPHEAWSLTMTIKFNGNYAGYMAIKSLTQTGFAPLEKIAGLYRYYMAVGY